MNTGVFRGVEFKQNIAIRFLKQMPDIKTVYAWDGYSTYNKGKEYSSHYSKWYNRINNGGAFLKDSMNKNGYYRYSTGLIKYYRDDSNNIIFSPNYKEFYEGNGETYWREKITEVID